MVIDGTASLSITSTTHPATAVTTVLELEPTTAAERGDPRGKARPDSSGAVVQRYYTHSAWGLDAPSANNPDDLTGFASLRALVAMLNGKEALLAHLREHYETVIWWHGRSDSTQGGFVLEPDLLVSLGRLGCALYGTVYVDESSSESEPA